MKKLVFIDPQSYSNLALYDYNLLENLIGYDKVFVCSVLYDLKKPKDTYLKHYFKYNIVHNSFAKLISYLCLYMDIRA